MIPSLHNPVVVGAWFTSRPEFEFLRPKSRSRGLEKNNIASETEFDDNSLIARTTC